MNRYLVLLSLASLTACGGSSEKSNVLCQGGSGTCAAVATSIFNADFTGMGTLDTVNVDTKATTLNIDSTLDADTTLKLHDNTLYELQRDSGAVRLYDPSTFKVSMELPTGDTANPAGSSYPEDFYVADDGKIWVTLSGNKAANALGIVDPAASGTLAYVALPQVASDTDGMPEANKIYPCNGMLYVTLQSYTVGTNNAVTYAPGEIVPVNPTTMAVGTPIVLTGKDPSDIRAVGSDCSDVLVANSSSTVTSPDGTGDVERVNLKTGTVSVVATDTTLGGRPVYLAINGEKVFIAEYFDPEPNGMGQTFLSSVKLVGYDLSSNTLTGDITGKFGNINFLELSSGNLYFGAGVFSTVEAAGKLPRGLYITPADGSMVTAAPIDLSLTPSAIALP